jgi:hypothetical protein
VAPRAPVDVPAPKRPPACGCCAPKGEGEVAPKGLAPNRPPPAADDWPKAGADEAPKGLGCWGAPKAAKHTSKGLSVLTPS